MLSLAPSAMIFETNQKHPESSFDVIRLSGFPEFLEIPGGAKVWERLQNQVFGSLVSKRKGPELREGCSKMSSLEIVPEFSSRNGEVSCGSETPPCTRAGGQDDGSLHKLPQTNVGRGC